jgi:NAD(P)-dependent dehydrogenase (short-subunit alcohol dehydrogenase family)
MDMQLDGRAVLVTGAGGGIGRATAVAMAAEGARLILTDIDKDDLAETAGLAAPGPGGTDPVAITADLSTARGVSQAMTGALEATDGSVDVFVSCAGVCRWRHMDELDDGAWDATMALNFAATRRAVSHLLPGMRRAGHGVIIAVTSDLARQPGPVPADYAVSKAALTCYMKALAREAGPQVRACCVAPGPVRTGIWDRPGGIAGHLAGTYGLPPDQAVEREISLRNLPLDRIGQPAEVAAVITMLASGRASYVTGATWDVNGGSIPTVP